MAVAHFYNGADLNEIKEFSESSDETLYYRTVVGAREYGDEKGYDGFDMDGDAYSLKDGKMTRVIHDTEPVELNPEEETDFTRAIREHYAETKSFTESIAIMQDNGMDLTQ